MYLYNITTCYKYYVLITIQAGSFTIWNIGGILKIYAKKCLLCHTSGSFTITLVSETSLGNNGSYNLYITPSTVFTKFRRPYVPLKFCRDITVC